MDLKPVFLVSDILLYLLLTIVIWLVWRACQVEQSRQSWKKVFKNPLGAVSSLVLLLYFSIGLLDSIHFNHAVTESEQGDTYYSTEVNSLLDVKLQPLSSHAEKTYSAPLAIHSFSKEVKTDSAGQAIRYFPLLKYAGQALQHPDDHRNDLIKRGVQALLFGLFLWLITTMALCKLRASHYQINWRDYANRIWRGKTRWPWRSILLTFLILLLGFFVMLFFAFDYHLMGTDKVGSDVLYTAIKSVRTALLIGTLTTLIMLPFALMLGTMAGYFGGVIDDIVQYVYTTLSSIPGVLLIAAAILAMQIYIDNHPDVFATVASRADARLLALCFILGVTSWTNLCRVLRAETLKLREMEYIQAAKALGGRWFYILRKHVLPNVMHIVLITVVLDFSTLILAEAVLTYVGVGVDPSMQSWGNMIDGARFELAREPVVWWPLLAAFTFMFIFVLAANLFADCVRDAFDPRFHGE